KNGELIEHAHKEYYQIFYIIKNSGVFCINGQTYTLGKNMLIFLHPGVIHGIRPITKERPLCLLETKFFVFSNELIDALQNIPIIQHNENDELRNFLSQAIIEAMNKDVFYIETVQALIGMILYKIIRQHRKFDPSNALASKPTTTVKEYVEIHFTEEISLTDLAAVTGYSKNYLCRIFREETYMTINEYLNTVRINKAAELLISTDQDIAQISKMTGYNNIFHFIKTFKKIIGISPGNYRRSSLFQEKNLYGPVEGKTFIVRTGIILSRDKKGQP
ncbi:MAG: AraC family transcriptional regulator, partial [Spirochaetaceae bacterium]|nr:AraC family transcriptional regulator [Spirochaetaceae bacterium]